MMETLEILKNPTLLAFISAAFGSIVGISIKLYTEVYFPQYLENKRQILITKRKYSNPILKSTNELLERLENIFSKIDNIKKDRWLRPLTPEEIKNIPVKRYHYISTIFCFAQLIGWIEILRKEHSYLDFTKEKETRVFNQYIKLIYDALNYSELSRHLPPSTDKWIVSHKLRSIGQIMIQRKDDNLYCMDFKTFCEAFKKSSEFRDWLNPLSCLIENLCDLYLFNWDEIPGNDNEKLINFLNQNFGIEWVKTAKIEKIDDGRTIQVSAKNNFLSLELNDKKTEVNLKIDDFRTHEFIVKPINGKLNIYDDSNDLRWRRLQITYVIIKEFINFVDPKHIKSYLKIKSYDETITDSSILVTALERGKIYNLKLPLEKIIISMKDDRPMANSHFKLISFRYKFRDFFLHRKNILKEVEIKTGFHVLNYGWSPGSYITAAAESVGKSGKIYALDIHPLAIHKVQNIVSKKKLTNVETINSDCRTGLANNSIDLVLLYDTFHELSDPNGVLEELHRVLKTNGILSFSDRHMKENKIKSKVTNKGLFKFLRKGKVTYSFMKEEL